MLDQKKHVVLLRQILREIYQDHVLQSQLAFKGGTCLYFFYELDRFSTDLDFNLLVPTFAPEYLTKIVSKYLQLNDFSDKQNTYFWLGSYEKGSQKIKLEVSKRNFPDRYMNQNFFGLDIPTMSPEYMFSHKLCAITDRSRLQNRDLYDAWFMFQKQWDVNEEIIRLRTGKDKDAYLRDLIVFLEKLDHKSVLDGLGEVLSAEKKRWAKENLLKELLFQLHIRVD